MVTGYKAHRTDCWRYIYIPNKSFNIVGIKQYMVSCLWSTGYIPISSWKFQLSKKKKKTVRRYGTWRYFAVVVVHRLQLRSKEVPTFANGEFNQQRWWGLTPEKMLVYVGLCGFIHEWQKQRMWTNKDLVLSCGSGDLHAFTQYFSHPRGVER